MQKNEEGRILMAGRKPKPTAIKKLEGNPGKRKLNTKEPVPVKGMPNESAIKATIDFTSYKQVTENALPKFKYYAKMMAALKKTLDDEIKPLVNVNH